MHSSAECGVLSAVNELHLRRYREFNAGDGANAHEEKAKYSERG